MSARPPPPPPASMVDVSAFTRQSRTYEPGDPGLAGKRLKKFRLDELQRIPREYRDIHRALHRIMPELLFEAGFLGKVREILNRYTEMDIDLWLHAVRVSKRTHLRALVPGVTFIAVIGLEPLGEKVLIEIDMRFVYRVVDRLLGGHGLSVDIHRSLTEIEQGVFSFMLLKVLALFQSEMSAGEQVAVRLEDMRNDLRSVADIIRHDDFWLVASWKMNFDLDVGFVRIFLPTSLARRVVPERPPPESPLAARMRDRIRRRMNRLAGTQVWASVEIGRIELTPQDVEALDPGDIILLDDTQVTLSHGEVSGRATMSVGKGQHAVVHGTVGVSDSSNGRQLTFVVDGIEAVERPDTHDPKDFHGEPGHPEEVMAEYEDHGENDDGASTPDDELDEDWGIDDESDGENDEYGDYEEGYEGEEAEEEAYEEDAPAEEVLIDDSDNLEESEPLLGDIPVQVVVELGRVQLTADEVIRLRAGHLMELGRSPADPVHLVVNGRLLARGELVEIEGALGVKILTLVTESE